MCVCVCNMFIYRKGNTKVKLHEPIGSKFWLQQEHVLFKVFLLIRTTFLAVFLSTVHVQQICGAQRCFSIYWSWSLSGSKVESDVGEFTEN